MRDLYKYSEECIDEMKSMGVEVSNLPNIIWTVSSRAKSRYGQCYMRSKSKCVIDISKFLLDESITPNEDALKNTIIHELLHALYPNDGHKGRWKNMADHITKASNGKYIIKRCTSYQEKGIDIEKLIVQHPKRSMPKYNIKCTNCGASYLRIKRTKIVKRPDLYKCGVCNGDLKVIELA